MWCQRCGGGLYQGGSEGHDSCRTKGLTGPHVGLRARAVERRASPQSHSCTMSGAVNVDRHRRCTLLQARASATSCAPPGPVASVFAARPDELHLADRDGSDGARQAAAPPQLRGRTLPGGVGVAPGAWRPAGCRVPSRRRLARSGVPSAVATAPMGPWRPSVRRCGGDGLARLGAAFGAVCCVARRSRGCRASRGKNGPFKRGRAIRASEVPQLELSPLPFSTRARVPGHSLSHCPGRSRGSALCRAVLSQTFDTRQSAPRCRPPCGRFRDSEPVLLVCLRRKAAGRGGPARPPHCLRTAKPHQSETLSFAPPHRPACGASWGSPRPRSRWPSRVRGSSGTQVPP